MPDLMAFPFQLNAAGNVLLQDADSIDYYAGELAQLSLTIRGERELVPDYGVTDPTYNQFDEVEFVAQVGIFGPPVTITSIDQSFQGEGRAVVTVDFDTIGDLQEQTFDDTDSVEEYFPSEDN